MKATILLTCLLGTFHISTAQSLIDSFPEFKHLSEEERQEFNTQHEAVVFFDPEKSIRMLINQFGPDFFKPNYEEQRLIINSYLKELFKPEHDYTSEESNFELWKDRLPAMEKNIHSDQLAGGTLYPSEKEIWSSTLSLKFSFEQSYGHWAFQDSTYALLSNYTSTYDELTQLNVIKELDQIYSLIDSSPSIKFKCTAYWVFMRNLYVDKNWNTLFYVAQRFIDDLIDAFISGDGKIDEATDISGIIFDRSIPTAEYEVIPIWEREMPPIFTNQKSLKENHLYWMVSTIKMLMSIPVDTFNTRDHIFHNFGKIDGLLESLTEFEKQHRSIKLLEIDYLKSLTVIDLFPIEYIEHYDYLIEKEFDSFQDKTNFDYYSINIRLSELVHLYRAHERIDKNRYFEIGNLAHVQCLFFAHAFLDKAHIDEIAYEQALCRLHISCSEYFLDNKQYEEASNILYSCLELIEKTPENFSQNDLSYTLTLLAFTHIASGKLDEARKWGDYFQPGWADQMINSEWALDIDQWTDSDFRQFGKLLIKVYENADDIPEHKVQELTSFNPIIQFIAERSELLFAEDKKYKKAYLLKNYSDTVFRAESKPISALWDIREENRMGVLRKKQLQLVSIIEEKHDENIELIEEYNSRTMILNGMRTKERNAQRRLSQLNDSIRSSKKQLGILKDSVNTFQDSTVNLNHIIETKDSLNFALRLSETKTQILNRRLDYKNVELNSNNHSLSNRNALLIIFSTIIALTLAGLVFFYVKLKRQKSEVDRQKTKVVEQKTIVEQERALSEALRNMVSQLNHFGTNMITSFKQRHFKNKEKFNQLSFEQANSELFEMQALLGIWSNDSNDGKHTETIQSEVKSGIKMAYVDFAEYYSKEELDVTCEIDDDLTLVKVPLHSISNMIYNAFKHSVPGSVRKIHLSGTMNSDNSINIQIDEIAEKYDDFDPKRIGKGTTFILQILDIFNRAVVTTNFNRGSTITGMTTSFNLKHSL